mgnify:CR=1 FL=1
MTVEKVIPILRIFDYKKAVEFYIDWLGFKINWEHHFEENTPVYMEVEKDGIVFHLSEHHGDGTPGTALFLPMEDIGEFHRELAAKRYGYARPGIEEMPWGRQVQIADPFGNAVELICYPAGETSYEKK